MWEDDLRSRLDSDDPDVRFHAAEQVAAAAGFPGQLTDEERAEVEQHGVPSDEVVELALRTVKDLCARETDEATLEELHDLRFRLGDAAAP